MSKRLFIAVVLGASVTAAGISLNAYAASPGGSIDIKSPKDGAEIAANMGVKVEYKVQHSSEGNHLHFYEDDGKPTIVREWSGSATLDALAPGKHQICIKEATKGHVLTGLEKCVSVTAK